MEHTTTVNRMVVGWDTSRVGETALRWALARAAAQHVERLDVLSVVPPGQAQATRMIAAESAARFEADRVTVDAGLLSTPIVVAGDDEEVMVEHTAADSLMVVGAEPRVGERERPRRSHSVRLAARAHGPVAVVPLGDDQGYEGPIVVGIDGSAASLAAAMFAGAEAATAGRELHLVHGWYLPIIWPGAYPLTDSYSGAFALEHERIVRDVEERLRERYPELSVSGAAVSGDASRAVLTSVPGASLIVVGRRRYGPITRLFLGSTSHEILLNTDIPVIVVPEP